MAIVRIATMWGLKGQQEPRAGTLPRSAHSIASPTISTFPFRAYNVSPPDAVFSLSPINDAAEVKLERTMGEIIFDGQAPFTLPVARAVAAVSSRKSVEIFLRLQAMPARQVAIVIAACVNQAVELTSLLGCTAGNALRSNPLSAPAL